MIGTSSRSTVWPFLTFLPALLADAISRTDIYIISSIIAGALLIFAGKGIAFIDALVFAAGASTGAGLKPVELNKLNTLQQVRPWRG